MLKSLWIVVLVASFSPAALGSSEPRDSITSGEPRVSYRIGDELHEKSWTLDPSLQPDTLTVTLQAGKSVDVCFTTDRDEFCRTVGIGDQYDFDIIYADVVHATRIVGKRFVPAAVFTEDYMRETRGRIIPVIPEVYELVNVAIAMTEFAQEDRWLVYKSSDYYGRVMERFADYVDHPFVLALNDELSTNRNYYARLKMNAYAFVYDSDGEIQRSEIYDRTGFWDSSENYLLPYLDEMRAFSRDTRFREFFAAEKETYDEQIRFYVEDVDLNGMNEWLKSRFPDVDAYDTVRIVLSPLVGGFQSVTWFGQGGFRELQPHVDFPYRRLKDVSPAGEVIYRGNIVFTELNHGYINPTAEAYAERIKRAIADLSHWGNENAASSYPTPMLMFNEYMNWGLIALYSIDRAPAEDHDVLLSRLDRTMGEKGRGFLQFAALRPFLVDLYVKREPEQTIADLYPAIVSWFELQAGVHPTGGETREE